MSAYTVKKKTKTKQCSDTILIPSGHAKAFTVTSDMLKASPMHTGPFGVRGQHAKPSLSP